MQTKFSISKSLKTLMVTAFLATSLAAPALAFNDSEKAEIGDVVREYLLKNPEILFEMQQAIESKRLADSQEKAKVALTRDFDKIFNSPNQITLGNPKGDVTVVEFYDYNCGYCQRAMTDMQKLIAEDDNIRFVLKEFPIFGERSIGAHKVSVAVSHIAPEKYQEFHTKLFSLQGQKTAERAMKIAGDLGMDVAKLKNDMESDRTIATLNENGALGNALGINGTPAYVFEGEVISGAVGYDSLKDIITNMRSCGKSECS